MGSMEENARSKTLYISCFELCLDLYSTWKQRIYIMALGFVLLIARNVDVVRCRGMLSL